MQGLVLSSRTALPVAGASVLAAPGLGTTTDANGWFELTAISGSTLQVSAEGHVSHTSRPVRAGADQLQVFVQPLTLTVTFDTEEGAEVDVQGAARVLIPPATGMQYANGDPVQGEVTLEIALYESGDPKQQQALPDAEAVDTDGRPFHVTLQDAIEITAFAGDQRCDAPEACVTGRVVAGGVPVAGATISGQRYGSWRTYWTSGYSCCSWFSCHYHGGYSSSYYSYDYFWYRNPELDTESSSGLGSLVELVAGQNYSCALQEAGDLFCWGSSIQGVLQYPESELGFVSLAGGASHACAADSAGHVTCWGNNMFSQSNVFQ